MDNGSSNGSHVPDEQRRIARERYQQLIASIREAGLMEPIVIFDRADHYDILSGCLRYRAACELGIQGIRCLLLEERPKLPEETEEPPNDPHQPHEPKEPRDG